MNLTNPQTAIHEMDAQYPMSSFDDEEDDDDDKPNVQSQDTNKENLINTNQNPNQKRFGAWDGVFAGCILNIFGVILFLRLGICAILSLLYFSRFCILTSPNVFFFVFFSTFALHLLGNFLFFVCFDCCFAKQYYF